VASKKTIVFGLILALSLFCLAGCAASKVAPQAATGVTPGGNLSPRATQSAFKGMELYSWQDAKGNWQFAVLAGTNRLKSAEEVRVHPLSLTQVEEQISGMAAGEQVLWLTQASDMSGAPIVFPLPPKGMVRELQDFAASRQVNLYLPGG